MRCRSRVVVACAVLSVCLSASTADATTVEWSIGAPEAEAGPRSFPAVAVHLRNTGAEAAAVRLELAVEKPLQSISPKQTVVELQPNEEKTLLQTLYVPPETAGGTAPLVSVREVGGATREVRVRIKSAASFKAKTDGVDSHFIRSGEKASYQLKIDNTGNTPLHFKLKPTTSPEKSRTKATPDTLLVAPGATGETTIEVEPTATIAAYTAFVTITDIQADEMPDAAAKECRYFHTEVFPPQTPPDRVALYETLKASVQIGGGDTIGSGKRGRSSGVFNETLAIDGLIAEETRLQFLQAFTHPSERRGELSSALAALPGSSQRNFFHLGLYNPHWDLELGEISAVAARLLSSRETGDGVRVAVRPLARPESVQVEVFAERNTLTLVRKDVFGAAISGRPAAGPIESWRVDTLSKRGDVGPQGKNWDSLAFESGWKLPVEIPLRAELSVGAGQNSEGQNGFAGLAGLHYNRTLPNEKDTSPVKAGVEFATGEKSFPGAQNGRDDRRAYVSFRISANPTYAEAYANYNESNYKVVPNIEKTLAEEQDIIPDFLRTSESRLLNAGLRWKRSSEPSEAWRLPSGNFEIQQTSYFTNSNFLDRADEKAAALNLTLFDRPQPGLGGGTWEVNLASRGGIEMHENGGAEKSESRFLTTGPDIRYTQPAPAFLEKIGGPGSLAVEFTGRYTKNFDGDRQALNRTGFNTSAAATWQTEEWSVRAASTIYSYENAGFASRASGSIERRIGRDWWAGIQGAVTTRGAETGRGASSTEGAVMLTFRHDFRIAVPWLPRKGQATGRVFEDVDNNGRFDPGEPGLAGVKVAAGKFQALTDADGNFTLPAMENGKHPLTITPPSEVHYSENEARKSTEVQLTKGEVTTLPIGLIKPTVCEGQVRFAQAKNPDADVLQAISGGDDKPDLAGYELIATDATGRQTRGFTRADGFFSLYLEPGKYQIEIDSASLRSQQSVTPLHLTVSVNRTRIENLEFTVTDHPKRIRKTFIAGNE